MNRVWRPNRVKGADGAKHDQQRVEDQHDQRSEGFSTESYCEPDRQWHQRQHGSCLGAGRRDYTHERLPGPSPTDRETGHQDLQRDLPDDRASGLEPPDLGPREDSLGSLPAR